ncbi:MAG: DUF3572 domain-containing protein [Pseudomonadota bacterium]
MAPDNDHASATALLAISFLAEDPGRLAAFMASAGVTPVDLRSRLSQPDFQAGVLEYIVSDENLLLGFAAHANLPPERVDTLRALITGKDQEIQSI